MSNIHDGPLATYNSLADPNLAGYFGNTRMRRQLRRAGLINRQGSIISENQYRINMARKEHKKHVKDLLAQAIVHKTLDLERYRQVEIKKKLEEISKIELVRRVRATRGRKGDEEVLPYLSPRSHSRPQSGRHSEASSGKRPKSAPSRQPKHRVHPSNGYVDPYHDIYPENNNYRRMVIYVDDDGRPVSPPPPSDRQSQMKTEEIDSRHLYALDSEALQKYANKLSRMEKGRDGATSPYVISQFPTPPRRARSAKSSPRRSARMSQSPTYKEKKPGSVRDGQLVTSDKDPDTVEGGLMLHRQEPAMMHQGEVQTLCEITMRYHGPNLTLPRDQRDPTQEVAIEQQHCGGNTLPVFKERLRAGSSFSFISRRHRGYPFSMTLYIDGRVDCRVSTCCEYKHAVGVRLGGKMGHFSLTGITGATPCYKCKLSVQAPPRSLKLKKSSSRKKKQPEQLQEEVTVNGTPRTQVDREQKKEVSGQEDDEYEDDFDEDEDSKEKQYEDDFEDEEPAEPKEDKRQIIGLKADEIHENGRTISVDVKEAEQREKQAEDDALLPPHRRVEGFSSEDEDMEGGRRQQVTVDIHTDKKKEASPKKRRSSSSSSSSSGSSREPTPREVQQEVKPRVVPVTPIKKAEEQSREEEPAHVVALSARSEDSSLPKTDRSTTSSNSLTTETESTLEPSFKRKTDGEVGKPKQRTISSSTSSSSSSDSEDDRLERKRRERKRKEDEEKRKKEEAERETERKKRAEEDEMRRKQEDEERKKRFALERQASVEKMKAIEAERKKRELELEAKKQEEERIKAEEQRKRQIEEERIKAEYEKELQRIKVEREKEQTTAREEVKQKEEQKQDKTEDEYSRFAEMRFRQVRTEIKPVRKEKESSSSSSSSSESESENEDKKETKKPTEPTPAVPKVEEKKPLPVESSSSSTTTSSESSSGSESEREKQKPAPLAAMTTIKEEKVEKKVEPEVKAAPRKSSSSSGSSSSSSDSESDTEVEEKKKSPAPQLQSARVPSPEVKQEEATPKKKSPPPRSSSSSSTSGSSSDSEAEKQTPQKQVTPPPFGGLHHERPLEDKTVTAEAEKQPVKKAVAESEDSSSDSSSSGSDSDSDSEAEKKPTKQTPTSESEGETMHGGADPEHVADGAPKGSTLAQSKVTPAEPQEGSIMGQIEGKPDIDLNGVLLNEDQIAQLSSYIVEAENLTTLSLRNSGLTDHSFGRLALAIQISEAKPKILNLGLNELGPDSMQPLTAALKKTPSVEVLILNGNPIGDAGYKQLVSAMVSHSAKDPFPFLRRSSGYMTPSETRTLNPDSSSRPIDTAESNLTPGTCQLTELGLAETKVTDAGITEISRLLETSTTLSSLNLNGNKNITNEGWARLSQAIGRNKTLKNLSLDFCRLTDDGIAILSKGLRVNTTLRSLELECTGLTEKGGLLLRDLLKENTSILQVTVMPGNSISEGMMSEIRKYLALNNAGYSST